MIKIDGKQRQLFGIFRSRKLRDDRSFKLEQKQIIKIIFHS